MFRTSDNFSLGYINVHILFPEVTNLLKHFPLGFPTFRPLLTYTIPLLSGPLPSNNLANTALFIRIARNRAIRPKNKHRWRSLFLTCRGEKICTVLNNDMVGIFFHQRTPGNINAKSPLLRVMAIIAWHELNSSVVPCWISTAPCPASHLPHPSPNLPPFYPQHPAYVTQFCLITKKMISAGRKPSLSDTLITRHTFELPVALVSCRRHWHLLTPVWSGEGGSLLDFCSCQREINPS